MNRKCRDDAASILNTFSASGESGLHAKSMVDARLGMPRSLVVCFEAIGAVRAFDKCAARPKQPALEMDNLIFCCSTRHVNQSERLCYVTYEHIF